MNQQSNKITQSACCHCGEAVLDSLNVHGEEQFCCRGCLNVYLILSENGLGNFYEMVDGVAGVRPDSISEYSYLDDVLDQLALFNSEDCVRIRLSLPAIHCISCVWLLENFHLVESGVKSGRVNFSKREVLFNYDPREIKLSQLATVLATMGYAPEFSLADEGCDSSKKMTKESRRELGKIALAGFCCGNIMMMSFPAYFGLSIDNQYGEFFAWLNLVFVLPLVFYCGADFWRSVPVFIKTRKVSLDLPIAVGIAALFFQTCLEIIRGTGEGYADSLGGFIFFLLLGRYFQKVTYQRLSFERDYKAFFPLSVTQVRGDVESSEAVQNIAAGDLLSLRSGDLLPVDGVVKEGVAGMDYSFVTGESEVVEVAVGEKVYAGGRQVHGAVRVEALGAVDTSYLASLWDDETFRENKDFGEAEISRLAGKLFTTAVPVIALSASVFWAMKDFNRSLEVFISVLIVACPCALALSVPLSFGFSMRFLGRRGFFMKNAGVIEKMSKASAYVFDKTGTLSCSDKCSVEWTAADPLDRNAMALTEREKVLVYNLSKQSAHPKSQALVKEFSAYGQEVRVADFIEITGRGISARIDGVLVELKAGGEAGTELLIDQVSRGHFEIRNAWRSGWKQALKGLSQGSFFVLSGDSDRDRIALEKHLPDGCELNFRQTPANKLAKIKQLRLEHKSVLMFGDGLNDAGALREADVGIAVSEQALSFTPASDVIMKGDLIAQVHNIQAYMRWTMKVVTVSFTFSILYNLVGLFFAVTGRLSPLTSAILMPLSSFTILILCATGCWIGAVFYLPKGLVKGEDNKISKSGPDSAKDLSNNLNYRRT